MDDRTSEPESDVSDVSDVADFNYVWGFGAGLLIGGLAGSVAMLLLAPQSGKRTRSKIQRKSAELRKQAAGAAEDVEDAVVHTRDRARQITSDVREKAEDLQHRGGHMIDKQQGRVSAALAAGTKALHRS